MLTVARAIDEYLVERESRHDQHALAGSRSNARSRLKRLLAANPMLAETPMAALTVSLLAETKCDLRSKTDLAAALNRAARAHPDRLPPNMHFTIKNGLAGSHTAAQGLRKAQFGLPDSDVRAIVAAAWEVDREGRWGGGLARRVMVLAAGGMRFSQAVRMRVSDAQAARLMVPVSRKGSIAERRRMSPCRSRPT